MWIIFCRVHVSLSGHRIGGKELCNILESLRALLHFPGGKNPQWHVQWLHYAAAWAACRYLQREWAPEVLHTPSSLSLFKGTAHQVFLILSGCLWTCMSIYQWNFVNPKMSKEDKNVLCRSFCLDPQSTVRVHLKCQLSCADQWRSQLQSRGSWAHNFSVLIGFWVSYEFCLPGAKIF